MKFLAKFIPVLAFLFTCTVSAEVAVIVNASNNSAISDADIKRIFLGKNKSFADGAEVTPQNLKSGHATRTEFEQKVLGKSSKQVKAYWSKLIFSGKAKPLGESTSEQDAIAFVTRNPSAIAYIDASKVDDTVKVVKVF